MNWVAVGCIAILAILGLIGLKAGVVKMVYHLIGFALALVLTAIFAPMVSKVLIKDSSPSVQKAKEKVIETFHLDEIDFEKTLSKADFDKLNLPESIRDELEIFNFKEEYEKLDLEDAKDYLATSIATIIIQAIVYIAVFLVIWLIVFALFQALNLVNRVPGLRAANRLAGMIIGIIMGACVIFLFFVAVTALSNFPFGRNMLDMIESNSILNFWYNNNPLNGGFVSLADKFK